METLAVLMKGKCNANSMTFFFYPLYRQNKKEQHELTTLEKTKKSLTAKNAHLYKHLRNYSLTSHNGKWEYAFNRARKCDANCLYLILWEWMLLTKCMKVQVCWRFFAPDPDILMHWCGQQQTQFLCYSTLGVCIHWHVLCNWDGRPSP